MPHSNLYAVIEQGWRLWTVMTLQRLLEACRGNTIRGVVSQGDLAGSHIDFSTVMESRPCAG